MVPWKKADLGTWVYAQKACNENSGNESIANPRSPTVLFYVVYYLMVCAYVYYYRDAKPIVRYSKLQMVYSSMSHLILILLIASLVETKLIVRIT